MHRAAYAALGLPHRYELVDCADAAAVGVQLARLRAGEIGGANVTVPHKRLALELADAADDLALDVGAANVWVREGDAKVRAYNTDVQGLVEDVQPTLQRLRAACVIGNGGAALAAVAACRRLGAGPVYVTARRWLFGKPEWPRAEEFRSLDSVPMAWPMAPDPHAGPAWNTAVAQSDLVVQATSAGMLGASAGEGVAAIVPWRLLSSGAVAYDLVYNPEVTPFLAAAAAGGVVARGGLGMLVGQAAHAFKLWLRMDPPREQMRAAAERALLESRR
jgi:shikimate dehydrogenase